MKKFIVSFMMAAALVFSGSVAMAFSTEDVTGVYVTPKVGIGYVELDDIHGSNTGYSHGHDTAVVAGISAGYDFSKVYEVPVRAELEYLYRGNAKAELPTGRELESDAHSVMVNAYYDFKEVPVVTPYITAGCGTAWLGDGGTNFAYNFGGGIYYNITEHFAYDFSVRYIDYGRLVKSGYKVDQSGANIMVGVRYTF